MTQLAAHPLPIADTPARTNTRDILNPPKRPPPPKKGSLWLFMFIISHRPKRIYITYNHIYSIYLYIINYNIWTWDFLNIINHSKRFSGGGGSFCGFTYSPGVY